MGIWEARREEGEDEEEGRTTRHFVLEDHGSVSTTILCSSLTSLSLPLEMYLRYCVHPPGEAPTSKAFLSFFHISSSLPPSIPSSNRSSHISRILKYARETGGREEEEDGFSKEGGRKERKEGGGAEVGPVREWLCVRP